MTNTYKMPLNYHYKHTVAERLMRYVKIDTTADPESETQPSSMKQKDLSRLLVEELKQIYPNTNFTLVLGSDAASKLDKWHRSKELLEQIKVLVVKRPGAKPSEFDEISIKALDISSTSVRQSIAKRENVSSLLPAKVVTYIREYGLYGSR
jgi:nicotinate (nicotinamide) nucleotide adenylyltransferase